MLENFINSKCGKWLSGVFIGGTILLSSVAVLAEDAVLTVLCSGVRGTPISMKKIEDAIKDQSYVLNVNYRTTQGSMNDISGHLDTSIFNGSQIKNASIRGIVLVGHGLGGIIERNYIECGDKNFKDFASKVKAIVMLATPNHGCSLADIACYHAALSGNRSDSIPLSIIALTDSLKPKDLGEVIQVYENLNKTKSLTDILNIANNNFGEAAFYLNSVSDGFIKNKLNKFGLRQDVHYYVIIGTDGSLPMASKITNAPSDGIVSLKSADISDLVQNKENYSFKTVNANYFNIAENKDAINIIKEVVGNVKSNVCNIRVNPNLSITNLPPVPSGWTFETRVVDVATPQNRETKDITIYKNTIGMEFALIPAGEFMMGSEKEEIDEKPVHRVRITKPFYMGICEVTQTQYENIMGTNPSFFNREDLKKARPVEQVMWEDAVKFCSLLSKKENITYRLPTEAEWEYACRAGSNTEYSFGNNPGDYSVKMCMTRSNNGTTLIPYSLPNAWGLHDMHGNVFEWCQDLYSEDYYKRSAIDDPLANLTIQRLYEIHIMRGGCYKSDFRDLRSAARGAALKMYVAAHRATEMVDARDPTFLGRGYYKRSYEPNQFGLRVVASP